MRKKIMCTLTIGAMLFTAVPSWASEPDIHWEEGQDAQAAEVLLDDAETETPIDTEERSILEAGDGNGQNPEPVAEPEAGSTEPAAETETGSTELENEVVTEPADPAPKNGFCEEDGRYYVNDVFVTGFVNLSGNLWYFASSGIAYTGKGWKTLDGRKVYALGNGTVVANAVKKIGKSFYAFKADGTLNKTKGIIKCGGKEYLGNGKGTLKTGWQVIKKNTSCAYFAKSTAAMVKNKKIGYLKVPKSGRLGSAYARGIVILNKKGWKLRKAFDFAVDNTEYAYHGMRRSSAEAYANFGFTKKKGNCYVFAGQFYVLAKLLGYNVRQLDGNINKPGHPHSWCVIKHKNGTWVYDPSFHDHGRRHKHGKVIGTGYHIKYGTKNTWKYQKRTNYMN